MKPFDAAGAFAPTVPVGGDSLRRLAVRGAGKTILSGGYVLIIQVVATVFLARLLTPRDFGVVTMVTTFSLLLSAFGLNGFTEALIQRETIDDAVSSNLFWIVAGCGLCLAGGFAVAGRFLAHFYAEPSVAPISAGIAVSIFIDTLAVMHLALLKRAMRFSTVANNQVIARAASVVVSIAFGLAGYGYWALVLGAIGQCLCGTIGAWLLCRWIPGRPRRRVGTAAMVRFAMYTYGRYTVNYCTRNIDNLLVGWRFGAPALGFYKKAYDLFSLSATQLVASTSVVAVSALSRVVDDSAKYRRYLLGSISVMAFIGMAISGNLTLIGSDIIRLLLGPGWGTAGKIFTYFAPGIGIMIVYGTHGWIHLSIGRADRWFRWGVVEWTTTVLLFIAGLHWGPAGIAAAWCISFWILTIPAMAYAGQPIGLGVGVVIGAVWRYTVAALAAGFASEFALLKTHILVQATGAPGALLRVLFVTTVFLALYLAGVILLHRGFGPLKTMLGLLREMSSARRAPQPAPVVRENEPELAKAGVLLLCFAGALSLAPPQPVLAQPGPALFKPSQSIDWSHAGVGVIPARSTTCARLTPSATAAAINAALKACGQNQSVSLAPGAYNLDGTLQIPANVTLRGAGADKTILNAVGHSGGAVIAMGSGQVAYHPFRIIAGATSGSTTLMVSNPSMIQPGMYLVIAEINDPAFVSTVGSGGNCNWCDGGWTEKGNFARGQIVSVTAVAGSSVSIEPGLYSSYTHTPVGVPFIMAVSYAGVEDLQVVASNSGYASNFIMAQCAYCWISGVESNYTDGDHVEVFWGFHDEIRDSYFSNAFLHQPGTHDSDLQIASKTTASLIENNIIERTHTAIMLEWGAAGNVVGYNYTTGEFDAQATNLVIGGIDFHGAHPQFNLLEGNVLTMIDEDSVWGSASHTTAFRNWVVGTNKICSPIAGRAPVSCSAAASHYGFQAARAVELVYSGTANQFIGNVIGSSQMQALKGYNAPLAQQQQIEYPATRNYDAVAYGWSFGYGSTSDDGTGSGCGGGQPPCHHAGIASAQLLHGNYNNIGAGTQWTSGLSRDLPASFYRAGKPDWWGALPFPSTGPDVAGGSGPGGHSYGNPAQHCYLRVMNGSDGGAGSPLIFNRERCYGSQSESSRPQQRYGKVDFATAEKFHVPNQTEGYQ